MLVLRDYQGRDVQRIRESYKNRKRAPLYQLPTAGGKTVIFTYVAKSAHGQAKRVVILVHRHELLMQTSRALDKFAVPHGLISPKFTPSGNQIQVASVQTLARRLKQNSQFLADIDLIVVDEAHHTVSDTWRNIIDAAPKARILGVTATPERLDGRGLGISAGGYYDDLIIGPSVKALIDRGFLAKYDYYLPPTDIDLKGVRKKMGDYEKRELANRIDKPKVTGSAVEHYKKLCGGKPAIAFCVSIEHAEHVAADFRSAGFRSECIHGKLPDTDRKRMIEGLENGSVQVLTSADLISEGTDVPCVTAAIMLRPTQSTTLWLQQIGRALRVHPSKDRAIILDHVGGVWTHGEPDEQREWSLEGSSKREKKRPALKVCPQCFGTHKPAPKCPLCGWVYPETGAGRQVEQAEGELRKITEADRERLKQQRRQKINAARTPEQLEKVAKEFGFHKNWVFHTLQAREKKRAGGKG